ncbi:MAG: hypothetical protein KAI50_14260 [Desulfobacterales bacterium]|nr:hypothetical protein [Desulfobacterales bacterium]
MIQIAADFAKLYTSFYKTKGYGEKPGIIHPMARAQHMDALSRTFLLILKKVAFNQAVFSGRKTIPQTSKPGSDTHMVPGQRGAGWTLESKERRRYHILNPQWANIRFAPLRLSKFKRQARRPVLPY